jgi:hypothetical protein
MTAKASTSKPLITVQSGPRNARTDPESGLRFYRWQGIEYPSVTSIRRLAGMPFMLSNWYQNKIIARAIEENATLQRMLKDGTDLKAVASWLRAAPNVERDAAADLGRRVHDAAAEGKTMAEVGADVGPFLAQYRSWLSDTKGTVVASERQVWSLTHGYAGTFDLMVEYPNGHVWLWDLKTGKGTYPEHALQLEAYRRADFVGEDDVVDTKASDLLRKVRGQGVLHLQGDGWTAKSIPSNEANWHAFLGLLEFATWTHENPTIDTLVSNEKSGKAVSI